MFRRLAMCIATERDPPTRVQHQRPNSPSPKEDRLASGTLPPLDFAGAKVCRPPALLNGPLRKSLGPGQFDTKGKNAFFRARQSANPDGMA